MFLVLEWRCDGLPGLEFPIKVVGFRAASWPSVAIMRKQLGQHPTRSLRMIYLKRNTVNDLPRACFVLIHAISRLLFYVGLAKISCPVFCA